MSDRDGSLKNGFIEVPVGTKEILPLLSLSNFVFTVSQSLTIKIHLLFVHT